MVCGELRFTPRAAEKQELCKWKTQNINAVGSGEIGFG